MAAQTRRPTPFQPVDVNAAELPAQLAASWRSIATLPLAVAVEGLRFAGRRLLAQANHLSEMANCHSLAEAAEAQSSFTQETFNDYRMEADAMMTEIRTTLSSSTSAP